MTLFDPTAPARPAATVKYIEGPRGPAGPAGAPGSGSGGARAAVFSEPTSVGSSGTFRVSAAATATLASLRAAAAPVGSALTVEFLVNGEEIATLTIAAGSTTQATADLDVALQAGDLLAVNATSIGSTTPAEGVVAQIDLS